MTGDIPIAVVGMAYRAPGIGRKGLWEYLSEARSAWSKIPEDRFDHSAYYHPGAVDKSGVFRTEGAHFVPGNVFAFDAAFFNMRAEEARNSDPQHRMLLECALEASEDAGYSLLDLAGKHVGVFVGCGQHEYSERLADDHHTAGTYSATGTAPCMVANRISYFFDVDGPSVALDAACASSVYAAHQAVSALRNRECDAAFVGSAALTLGPGGWLILEKTGALSAHGRSFSYDEKAAGFGRGEGGACLLVKRIDDAIRDGDPVHAVIRSSACNHGGRSDGGITMPNGLAHESLLRQVHGAVGLDPADTPVVEGHGTGTYVGDPIEAGAFAEVLAEKRTADNPIYIGSIKSNFGHLEGASGMLGMVKAILMVKNGVILPTAGFEKMNPKIKGQQKMRVVQGPTAWPKNEQRRVLVTNFGFGGSNSAIILEQAPSGDAGVQTKTDGHENGTNGINGDSITTNHGNDCTGGGGQRLFVLSAKSENSLKAYLSAFDEYLGKAPGTDDFVKDLSYTLGQRRSHHPHRVAVVADSVAHLQEKLLAVKPGRAKERTLAFVFTGQGAQYAQMASGLLHHAVFATALSEADRFLTRLGAPWSLADQLAQPASTTRINDAEISQPACTAVQLALVLLLASWGVTPSVVTGHSSGEIGAAFSAGLLSFETALAVAYFRGQAAARLARQEGGRRGAMLALGVGVDEANKLVQEGAGGYAIVAAINSPNSVTVSGDEEAVEGVRAAAEAQGLFARSLKVDMAYHSRHMDPVADWYHEAIRTFFTADNTRGSGPSAGSAVFVSSVAGRVADPAEVDATYWVKNLVQPVRFAEAVRAMFTTAGRAGQAAVPDLLVEVGPHPALKGPVRQTLESIARESTTYLATLVRGNTGDEALLSLAADLFTMGVRVRLGGINRTSKDNARVVTGLPAYEWDKSAAYENRPRFAHEKLFPGDAYHPLLGRRQISNGGRERSYRQVFTLDEAPWIRDHSVAGAVVFPMTGYISMAIEAARRTLSGLAAAFLVKEFHIVARLEIQEEERVEMVTTLRPAATGTGTFSPTTWAFDISSYSEAHRMWTVHTYGQVTPEMAKMHADTPTLSASLALIHTTPAPDLVEHDISKTYEQASVRATRYGPTFKNSVRFFEGKGYTILEHKLRDIPPSRGAGVHGSPVTTDPPTLDGFLQGGGPLQVGPDGRQPAQMPNYMSRFRVSNTIPSEPGQRIDIVTRLLDYDFKGGRMDIGVAAFARAADGKTLTPVAEWESLAFRSIGSADEDMDPVSALPDTWAWTVLPKVDLLPADVLSRKLTAAPVSRDGVAHRHDLEAVAYDYIRRAVQETAGVDRSGLPYHLAQFLRWADRNVTANNPAAHLEAEPAALRESVRTYNAQGELLCVMGESLAAILRLEVDPLELMLAEGRLSRHYESDVLNAYLSHVLGDVAEMMRDMEGPDLRIIEVGGGTGGTTLPVIEALTRNGREGQPPFSEYTFTDISTGFFENARAKLARWPQGSIRYKQLDISRDPSGQGFEPGSFDVVIASNVLHATRDMGATMANVRSLLRPRGRLLLLEGNRHLASFFPFFLLPGWWYAEDQYRDRDEGPMMAVDTWDRLLRDTGFSGVEINLHDLPQEADRCMSIITSTRIGKADHSSPVPIVVSGPFLDDEEVGFARSVADAISSALDGYPTEIRPLSEAETARRPYYVFIDSPRASVFEDVTQEIFDSLQKLLVHNAGVLWVIPEGGPPASKFVKGMLRTLRLENDAKNLLLFDDVPLTDPGIAAITRLTEQLRDPEPTRIADQDFAWHDGAVHVPRMRLLEDVKEQFAVERGVSLRKEQGIWDGDRALEMTVDAAGNPDSIYYRRTDDLQKPLGEDEILVQVEAAGVSHRDLSLILGNVPWAPPGFDGVGKVVRTGGRVAEFHEGDAVLFLAAEGGAFATYKVLGSWQAARVPAAISTTEAAGLPLAYTIAVLALLQTARLARGETVLVHNADGAVGQACVALARHVGAEIYATASTAQKREFCQSALGIPADRVFSSSDASFRDGVLTATGGRGVDVIANTLGGELMAETWALVGEFGRFVEIGKGDARANAYLPMRPFDRNATFSTVDVRGLARRRPRELKVALGRVWRLLGSGDIVVPLKPVTVFPISEFPKALSRLRGAAAADHHSGKIVVTLGAEERVQAETPLRPLEHRLRAHDATYLVTGGTRGIGLNLAHWMVENGAKNVVVLGRSGASGPEVQKLLKKYEGTDVTVRALACDVGCRDEVAGALEAIRDLPPVRGVVHSALLLSDKLFENATHDDWATITRPRVQGAWNLDALLPKDMDFFVALGSFVGDTGNGGQAIYAGTASFYDAFAQRRMGKNQHTVTIALPVVTDVGYVADNDLTGLLKLTLGATLGVADIRVLFKAATMPPETSPFVHSGKVAAFSLFVDGQRARAEAWGCFHPVLARERLKEKDRARARAKRSSSWDGGAAGGWGGGDADKTQRTAAAAAEGDPRERLTRALIHKVSAMTIIPVEDVRPTTPLADFGLDSLVSVELRNWIRRETGAELTLSAIVQAENLSALAVDILAKREGASRLG